MRRVLLLALLASACNPYDPDLGDIPFQCGTDEPRCPEGYVSVDVTVIRCECQLASIAEPPGGGPYECIEDVQEPNGTVATAFVTPVGELNVSATIHASVCPADDEDHLSFQVARASTVVRLDTHFDLERPAPTVEILRADGASIDHTTIAGATPGVLVTTMPPPPPGRYVIRVRASREVNYRVEITTFPPQ